MDLCRDVREAAVSYNPILGIYGFFTEIILDGLVKNYLSVEHLWVKHILRLTNPKRSKFLPVYACIRDLHVLILCGISYAITHGEVKIDHGQNGEIITYYRA